MRRVTNRTAAVALMIAALPACSRGVSDWHGVWTGVMSGSAVFPGCTSNTGERAVVLELTQTGERVTGTASFANGGPAGSCTFVNAVGQAKTFDWAALAKHVPWLKAGPGATASVGGTVAGKILDLDGLRLTQTSITQARATISLERFDAEGELTVAISRDGA